MDEISLDEGIEIALTALHADRLALLCGAGLSMADPSNLPSAAQLASEAKRKHDAQYGASRPPLPAGIEEQAEYFFRRGELGTVYLRTLVLDVKSQRVGVMVSLNPMTEASAGSGGSRDLIMLQMLAPMSDIVFLNTSPQAPVEIANNVMMQPIARTLRRRTAITFDASPRQPIPMPTSGNRVTNASDPVAASSLATDATAQAKKATAQVRRRRNTSASIVSKQRSRSVRAVRIVKTTRPTR